MEKSLRELLLKDLCSRLPCGLMVQPISSVAPHRLIGYDKGLVRIDTDQQYSLENIKPYLRPMLSMTEEEKKEYAMLFRAFSCSMYERESVERIDWLNAHHFDCRCLIPMGLALPAKDGMYNIK